MGGVRIADLGYSRWAQKLGVPGAVVKDVGLFIDWIAKRRKSTP